MRVGTLQILRRARDVDRETLAVAGKRNGREQRQSEGEGRKTQGRRGEGEAELRQKMEPARESFRETCCCREALASRSAEQHLSRDAVRLGRRPGGRASHVPRSPLHSRRNAQRKRRGQRALLQRRGRRWQQGQSRSDVSRALRLTHSQPARGLSVRAWACHTPTSCRAAAHGPEPPAELRHPCPRRRPEQKSACCRRRRSRSADQRVPAAEQQKQASVSWWSR